MCKDNNFNIREGFIYSSVDDRPITIIPKEFINLELIAQCIRVLDGYAYKTYFTSPCEYSASASAYNTKDGCKLILCGDHRVDFSGDSVYVDKIKFESSKVETNTTFGDYSPIGDYYNSNSGRDNVVNNQLNYFYCTVSFAGGAIIGGILTFLWGWWKSKNRKRVKQNKKNSRRKAKN
jgi:hypothetical protein